MSEKFLNDRGLKIFYDGLKTRFIRFNNDDSNTYLKNTISTYMAGNNFKDSDNNNVSLKKYIQDIVEAMLISKEVSALLDEKYDDVKVFDFKSLAVACDYYTGVIETKKNNTVIYTEIEIYQSQINNLDNIYDTLVSITTESDFNTKYTLLSDTIKNYLPQYNAPGKVFSVFPFEGIEDVLYVDTTNDIQYTWNDTTKEYEASAEPINLSAVSDMFNN